MKVIEFEKVLVKNVIFMIGDGMGNLYIMGYCYFKVNYLDKCVF